MSTKKKGWPFFLREHQDRCGKLNSALKRFETDLPVEFRAALDVEAAPLFAHRAAPLGGGRRGAVLARRRAAGRRVLADLVVVQEGGRAALPGGGRVRPVVQRAGDEVLLVGRHHHGLLVDVLAAVGEDLVADVADVLERGGRPRRVEHKHVGGRLAQAAERGRRRGLAVQVPLLDRVLGELVDGREVGDVDLDDAAVGHEARRVALRVHRGTCAVAEFVAHELLQDRRNDMEKKTNKYGIIRFEFGAKNYCNEIGLVEIAFGATSRF